ncbi:hypothetical protein [Pseudoalteromonas luteoviolacea]|uniref:Pullulanase n=1 Tax=Pseudoalteromonas luteoviolacea NCIMB 1942 TaxID=1365253 RepID=A0A166ZH69_9GAMM|nr:hypothetical protein [Pseudoalteromonas luteoviolacea]KZN44310.1 hypothetical protein N482_16845 [Pseudoalteromonas luteoviolacea NCIMB 1942]KZW99307.1 hypothetical protein JL49_18060 [Pseudoalteromonas luteoviolacea]
MQKNTAISLLLVLGITGCASPNITPEGPMSIQRNAKLFERAMYLRGDFSLWDAEDIYRLQPKGDGRYLVRARFMSPGKVYEFKIADEKWSEGYNCGYRFQGMVQLGQPLPVDCNTVYNYLSFAPDKKGWYSITLDYRDSSNPTVVVQRD